MRPCGTTPLRLPASPSNGRAKFRDGPPRSALVRQCGSSAARGRWQSVGQAFAQISAATNSTPDLCVAECVTARRHAGQTLLPSRSISIDFKTPVEELLLLKINPWVSVERDPHPRVSRWLPRTRGSHSLEESGVPSAAVGWPSGSPHDSPVDSLRAAGGFPGVTVGGSGGRPVTSPAAVLMLPTAPHRRAGSRLVTRRAAAGVGRRRLFRKGVQAPVAAWETPRQAHGAPKLA